jgi:hypothetical protein
MSAGRYKEFSNRLIVAMKTCGHVASRSPSGICMRTLSELAGASEQICRRYIRGDALPDYDKIVTIAAQLNVSPGWLLFGEGDQLKIAPQPNVIDDDLLHYILTKSYHLYREETGNTDDYADFVLELIHDVREISTSKENLHKIIELAVSSITSFKEKRYKQAVTS